MTHTLTRPTPERNAAMAAPELAESPITFATDAVRLKSTEIDPETGLRIHHLEVDDSYLELFRDYPDMRERVLADRQEVRAALADFEQRLRDNPNDPKILAESQNFIYASPAMRFWREELVPSAKALCPLYFPSDAHLPPRPRRPGEVGLIPMIRIDEVAHKLFAYSLDAEGMRSRASVLKALIVDNALRSGKSDLELLSLACGAAGPVFDSAVELRQRAPGIKLHMSLVDMSADALEFAQQLAGSRRFKIRSSEYTIWQRHLVRDLILPRGKFKQEYGRGRADIVDNMGIVDYLTKEQAAALLRESYDLMAPGGMDVFSNVLSTHPQLQVNQRAVGWPNIFPRSLAEIAEIIELSGIPKDDADVFLPEDGVYAVVRLNKRLPQVETIPIPRQRRRWLGARLFSFLQLLATS